MNTTKISCWDSSKSRQSRHGMCQIVFNTNEWFYKISLLTYLIFIFSGCSNKDHEKQTIKIEKLSYTVNSFGDGDDPNSEPFVYNMCTFMSLQGSLAIIKINKTTDVILSDHCQGGEYSNNVVIYDAEIINVIHGDIPQKNTVFYGFPGVIDKTLIGSTFLASTREYRDKYFIDFSIQASINGEVENNVPRDIIIDIPNDYMELVMAAQETAMNLDQCENITLLSDEEYDRFIAGDPEECVRPEDEEEEGPDWEAICAAADAPECCLNDLVDCEE